MFCVFSLVAGAENRSRLIVEVQRSFFNGATHRSLPFLPFPLPVILMEGVWSRIEYPSIPRPSRKRAGHFPEIRNCGKLRRHRGLKGMPAGMAPCAETQPGTPRRGSRSGSRTSGTCRAARESPRTAATNKNFHRCTKLFL